MKTPHSHYTKGKRVSVKLRNGPRITGRFVERKGRFIRLENATILTKEVASMSLASKGGIIR